MDEKSRWLVALAAVILIALASCDVGSQGQDGLSQQATPDGNGTELQCEQCHLENDSINPLIINGNGAAGKHQPHVTKREFACTTCHASYVDEPQHFNGEFDTGNPAITLVHFDSGNPNGYWEEGAGGGGGCGSTSCHGPDRVDWYSTDPLECKSCHFSNNAGYATSRRAVLGVTGDFADNPGVASHHVAGGGPPSEAQCKVCHDQSGHMQGAVLLRDADGGASVGYDPGHPESLEPFCLSCHDTDGATATFVIGGSALNPFNDGTTLGTPPYPFGKSIADSWAKNFGHGPIGNPAADKRLTCAGTGAAGTGCHGNNGEVNAHGSSNQVLAAAEFNYALSADTYAEQDYALCFGCHAAYPGVTKTDVLGVKQGGLLDLGYGPNGPNGRFPPYYTAGITTQFADHNELGDPFGLNDPFAFAPTDKNLHWYHLGIPSSDYRGTGAFSAIVCVNCHDVHGSNTAAGAMHDALGYGIATDGHGNSWGAFTMGTGAMGGAPTFCAVNCHQFIAPTKAWFAPIVE